MKNKPIHIVEAYFSDWDSSHFEILGIFTDINQAIKPQPIHYLGKAKVLNVIYLHKCKNIKKITKIQIRWILYGSRHRLTKFQAEV